MTTSSEKFYDRFSFLYPAIDLFLKPQKVLLFNEVNAQHFGRLLEVGIGNGSNLKYYKTHAVTGIDTSSSMLNHARKNVHKNSVQLFQMNGESLDFPDSTFDYVVLSHVIAVAEHPEKIMTEVHRVLKRNGKLFILNHFTPDNWLRYFDHSVRAISRIVHIKSVFTKETLGGLKNFTLLREVDAGLFSYFKILIYEKIR
jgi:phosphatidylethanolamine/phosphatidyl-N-methylethanolamine N-methyltransferase